MPELYRAADKTHHKMNARQPGNIDEYINYQPQDWREMLQKVRETIREAAPGAVESISYAMPAFKFRGRPLVYFALNRNHLGFYATPSANSAFSENLKGYRSSKGAVQFPLDRPIPYDLIRNMVQYKLEEINKLQREVK